LGQFFLGNHQRYDGTNRRHLNGLSTAPDSEKGQNRPNIGHSYPKQVNERQSGESLHAINDANDLLAVPSVNKDSSNGRENNNRQKAENCC
jgi:hypothetical protein